MWVLRLGNVLDRLAVGCAAIIGFDQQVTRQLYRFVLVGIAAFGVYLGIMALGVQMLGLHPALVAAAAFAGATLVSYLGNALWSFEAPIGGGNFIRFLAVVLFGLAVNVAMAWGLASLGVHFGLISLIVFLVIPPLNFVGHRRVTFRRPSESRSGE